MARNPSIEHVSTDDLVDELKARSRVFFMAMRPLADDPDFTAFYSLGVDGKLQTDTGEDRDRCFGLAESARFHMQCKVQGLLGDDE